MNTYKITVRSHGLTIGLAVFFLIIFFLVAGGLFPIVPVFVRVVLTIPILVLAHFSLRRMATAKTEWTLSDEGITVKWLSQYYKETNEDLDIKWTEIDKYKDVYGKGYNLFKIYLLNGDVLTFGHGGLFFTDEFNKFYELFQEMYIKHKHPEQWAKYYKRKAI